MKRILSVIFMSGLLLCQSVCDAQSTLTIEQCLDEAMRNNVKLRIADQDIESATEQRKELFTKYFPSISATGMGLTADKHLIDMNIGAMNMNFIKSGVAANVALMQPIFMGGQIINGNKLANVGEECSRLSRNMTADEVRLTTVSYYWQIVSLKEKLTTINKLELQIAKVCDDAQAAVAAGVRNRNDLLQAQLRNGEIRTNRIQVENALMIMRDLLAQYIGYSHSGFDVADTVDYAMPPLPNDLFVDASSALLQTNEYQLLCKQVESEQLKYKLAVGKNMPSVAIGGAYLYNNLLDKSSNNLVGMLSISVPISDWWGGSHAIKRQKLQVENAVFDRQDKSELLIVNIQKIWTGVTEAYQSLEIAQESLTQSEENLRLNTDYYSTGVSTISELLDAQSLYQQSRDRFVEAYAQYEIKKCEYLLSTGR